MTSNQIAYAQAVEDKRHNAVVEVETNRHNVETERLNDRELRIKEDFNQATIAYNNRMADIQKDYNDAYLAWQQATSERKLELEEQMNAIQAEKNAITEQYYANEKEWKTLQNQLESEKKQELIRHNQQLEALEAQRNANTMFIAEKQDLYNRYALDTETNVKMINLQQEQARLTLLHEQNMIKLGEFQLAVDNASVRNRVDVFKASIEATKASILKTKTALDTVNTFIGNVLKAGGK